MEDEMIISLFFDRNEDAIRETGEKYGKLCYKIAYNILGSHGDCEECVNDTYLKLWSVIPPSRPNSLKAYICKVVRTLSLMRLRSQNAKKRSPEATISLSELEAILPDKSIRQNIENEEIGEAINEFLGTISESSRRIFIRRYWYFDTVGDIAKKFSFSESKVKSDLYHSREKLRKLLITKGVRI